MTKMERVEKLLKELQYEVETGMMGGDIDEHLDFSFIVPISKNMRDGVVLCKFVTHPVHRGHAFGNAPRLRVVK